MIIIKENDEIYTISSIIMADWLNEDGTVKEALRNDGVRFLVEENSEMGQKIMTHNLRVKTVVTNGELVDVTPLPDIPQDNGSLLQSLLDKNSKMCNYTIENEFKSAAKGDGLQSYRMNRDDQANLNSKVGIINVLLAKDTPPEQIRLFSWGNENDWTYLQILSLADEFEIWKENILKRQDDIKEQIQNAADADEINAAEIDYSDLLVF